MSEETFRWAVRRPLSRRRLVATALSGAAGLAGAAFVACAGPKKTARRSTASAGETRAQAAGGTPQSGGAFNTYVNYNTPLDPQKTSGTSQQIVGGAMSRIFRFVAAPDPKVTEDHNIENDLGISAESPDAVTWTIKLRTDVKFHNIAPVNGHAVEAEDVKATFIRALDPATGNTYAGALGMIDPNQIQTPAHDTVVFKLNYPYSPFKRTLTNPFYSLILPREALAGAYDPTKVVIGSGPFIMVSTVPDVAYTYKKNPDWFEKGRPYVDNMRISIIPDVSQQIAQFTAGNLDEIIPSITNLDAVRQNDPKAQLTTADSGSAFTIRFQLGDPSGPFQDIRLRQALSMSVDRDALGKALLGGQGVASLSVPTYMGKWALQVKDLDPSVQQYYQYNLPEAKKLLSAAGATNGHFKLAFVATGLIATPAYQQMAEAVHSMLTALGVPIDMVPIDYVKDFVDAGKGYRQGYFAKDTMCAWYISPTTEADEILFGDFDSASTSNPSHVSDKDLDAMIAKERTILNDDERLKAVHDIEKYIAGNVYTLATVGQGYSYALVQPRIQNYGYTSSWGDLTETYSKVWIKA